MDFISIIKLTIFAAGVSASAGGCLEPVKPNCKRQTIDRSGDENTLRIKNKH